MGRLSNMSVIIKYPTQNEEINKDFFERKNKELTNLDWAKWGGWFDTDGNFSVYKTGKYQKTEVILSLKDREPVELFSKTFETSLCYDEFKTVTPNGNHYIAKQYKARLRNERAFWFTKNVKNYIFQKTKYVKKLLNIFNVNYIPYEYQLNRDELVNYIVSAIQGDGTIYDKNKINDLMRLYSSNENYLNFIVKQLNNYGITFSGPYKGGSYQTSIGTRHQFFLFLKINKNYENIISFYEEIIPKIDMTRKRENAISTLNWFKK